MTEPTTRTAPADQTTESAIDNKVRQIISNISNLPTPPIVFHQIQKAINDPKASAGQIAAVLAEDPAMSVKVLKLTNSAFYGLAREIESVKQAVVVVGMEAIKNLVLSASVMDMFKGKDHDADFQEQFWRHSLAAAFASRILARKLKEKGIADPDTAFSAGLLHDIGKIVAACFLKDEFEKVRQARQDNPVITDYKLEMQTLGYTHSDIGGLLAEQWKLPQKLGACIKYHHHPGKHPQKDPLAYVVHIGDYIAKRSFRDEETQLQLEELSSGVMDYMVIKEEDLENFCQALREEYLKAETFMQMAGLSA